jgi:hypothetical protein
MAGFIALLHFTNFISGTLAVVMGASAIIFLITSFVGFCHLYAPFGIDTRKNKQQRTNK